LKNESLWFASHYARPNLVTFLGQPALAFLFTGGYLGTRFDFGTILGYDWLTPLNVYEVNK
jgi:hypothetical protein